MSATSIQQPPPPAGRATRRDRIYPHRSIRSLAPSRFRFFAGLTLAAVLTALIVANAVAILELHSSISRTLAGWAGLPISGWTDAGVFPGLEPAAMPELEIPAFRDVSGGARFGLILLPVALLIIARRYPLFKNLANFLIVLLFASAVANAVFPEFRLASLVVGQIWLRQEMLVWILLPWMLLLLYIFPQPSLARGAAWTVGTIAYGFLFSAIRFVFLLGALHYTGILFLAPLWFLLGTLSDLLYVLFFYSISIHQSSGALWGARSSWQSHF